MSMTAAPAPTRHVKTSLPPWLDRQTPDGSLTTFLGLFSVGLGLAELAAPRSMARLTGVRFAPALLRAYGLRELASGVGILTNRRPTGWLWGRVAGDVMDLATLAAAYAEGGRHDRRRMVASAAAVAGVTALDVLCAGRHAAD